MVVIVLDEWAYRIRMDGIVESTSVEASLTQPLYKFRANRWEARSAEATGLEDGEAFEIREELKRLTSIFPSNRIARPTTSNQREPAETAGSDLR